MNWSRFGFKRCLCDCFIGRKFKAEGIQIRINLAAALFFAQVVFLSGINATENKVCIYYSYINSTKLIYFTADFHSVLCGYRYWLIYSVSLRFPAKSRPNWTVPVGQFLSHLLAVIRGKWTLSARSTRSGLHWQHVGIVVPNVSFSFAFRKRSRTFRAQNVLTLSYVLIDLIFNLNNVENQM